MFMNIGSRPGSKRITAANLNIRKSLSADTTFYVATTGSDLTGDGTRGKPFATPKAASDYLGGSIDLNGHMAIVQLADGSYPGVSFGPHSTAGWIMFMGNSSNPASVIIDTSLPGSATSCFKNARHQVPLIACGDMTLKGGRLLDFGEQPMIFWFWLGTKMVLNIPAASGAANMFIWGPARFVDQAWGGVDIVYDNPAQRGMIDLDYGGFASFTYIKNFTGTPAWTDAFVKLSGASLFEFDNAGPIAGTATGKKFILDGNSTIVNHGAGFDVYPGDAVGSPFKGFFSV